MKTNDSSSEEFKDLQEATDAWKREIEEVKRLNEERKELIGALDWSLTELRNSFELTEWANEKYRHYAFIKLNVAEEILKRSLAGNTLTKTI